MTPNLTKEYGVFALHFFLLLSPGYYKFFYLDFSLGGLRHLLIAHIALLSLYFITSLSNKKWMLWLLPLCLFTAIQWIHIVNYNEVISVGGWAAILETNFSEAREFALFKFSSLFVGIMLLVCFYFLIKHSNNKPNFFHPKLRMGCLGFGVLLAGEFILVGTSRGIYPLESVLGLQNYFQEKSRAKSLIKKREQFTYEAIRALPQEENVLREEFPGETYVVVIGESMRRKNLEIYGYDKPTNPKLHRETLLIFGDAISPANTTQEALKLMLSPATVSDPDLFYQTKSIVSLAKEVGFKTYWIGNQSRYGFRDTEITTMALECEKQIFTNTYWAIPSLDEKVLAPFKKITTLPESKKLIFIHLLGNHIDYRKRYPKNWTGGMPPLSEGTGKTEEIIHEYNLSLTYQDSLLHEIISVLKSKKEKSFMFFFSDHGELLYENRKDIGHGFPNPYKEEYDIPVFVWASNRYKQSFEQTWNNMAEITQSPFHGQDIFFHLADLLHIKSPRLSEFREVGSTQADAYNRQVLTPSREKKPYNSLL